MNNQSAYDAHMIGKKHKRKLEELAGIIPTDSKQVEPTPGTIVQPIIDNGLQSFKEENTETNGNV